MIGWQSTPPYLFPPHLVWLRAWGPRIIPLLPPLEEAVSPAGCLGLTLAGKHQLGGFLF